MSTGNAATSDKTVEKTGVEKTSEKLAEKRRALGRGLESLLPGPRVAPPAAPTSFPQNAGNDDAFQASASRSPFPSSSFPGELAGGRPGAAVTTRAVAFAELQAGTGGRAPDGELTFLLNLDQIE